jgi:protein-S-isoprenylcysteine O-methyltransferase Ste14
VGNLIVPKSIDFFFGALLSDARRHPIYLGFLLSLLEHTHDKPGHLLCALAISAYILLAIRFEEHDLAAVFGDTLRQYRGRIPMIVPFIKR